MTNEEAIAIVETLRFDDDDIALALTLLCDSARKQIPKKVIMRDCCPTCGSKGITETGDPYIDYELCYCNNCGQRLDWSKE